MARIVCRDIGLGSTSICSALLHDVVEDTIITIEELRERGIPEQCLDAIQLLTKEENVDYFDYIDTLKDNSIAIRVKMQDLVHNMDIERLILVEQKDIEMQQKYKKSYAKFLV